MLRWSSTCHVQTLKVYQFVVMESTKHNLLNMSSQMEPPCSPRIEVGYIELSYFTHAWNYGEFKNSTNVLSVTSQCTNSLWERQSWSQEPSEKLSEIPNHHETDVFVSSAVAHFKRCVNVCVNAQRTDTCLLLHLYVTFTPVIITPSHAFTLTNIVLFCGTLI